MLPHALDRDTLSLLYAINQHGTASLSHQDGDITQRSDTEDDDVSSSSSNSNTSRKQNKHPLKESCLEVFSRDLNSQLSKFLLTLLSTKSSPSSQNILESWTLTHSVNVLSTILSLYNQQQSSTIHPKKPLTSKCSYSTSNEIHLDLYTLASLHGLQIAIQKRLWMPLDIPFRSPSSQFSHLANIIETLARVIVSTPMALYQIQHKTNSLVEMKRVVKIVEALKSVGSGEALFLGRRVLQACLLAVERWNGEEEMEEQEDSCINEDDGGFIESLLELMQELEHLLLVECERNKSTNVKHEPLLDDWLLATPAVSKPLRPLLAPDIQQNAQARSIPNRKSKYSKKQPRQPVVIEHNTESSSSPCSSSCSSSSSSIESENESSSPRSGNSFDPEEDIDTRQATHTRSLRNNDNNNSRRSVSTINQQLSRTKLLRNRNPTKHRATIKPKHVKHGNRSSDADEFGESGGSSSSSTGFDESEQDNEGSSSESDQSSEQYMKPSLRLQQQQQRRASPRNIGHIPVVTLRNKRVVLQLANDNDNIRRRVLRKRFVAGEESRDDTEEEDSEDSEGKEEDTEKNESQGSAAAESEIDEGLHPIKRTSTTSTSQRKMGCSTGIRVPSNDRQLVITPRRRCVVASSDEGSACADEADHARSDDEHQADENEASVNSESTHESEPASSSNSCSDENGENLTPPQRIRQPPSRKKTQRVILSPSRQNIQSVSPPARRASRVNSGDNQKSRNRINPARTSKGCATEAAKIPPPRNTRNSLKRARQDSSDIETVTNHSGARLTRSRISGTLELAPEPWPGTKMKRA
ncbi:UNVERIFIED_CONTAM: hypothetical protein HDU68_000530 [Siphonaria sp. JEL0065]|nr:hypothetical protein HDU68_000530 [Siphonaria sp. JEL0065]